MAKDKKQISSQNLAVFCEQTAMLLRSGILLHEGIGMMAQDAPAGTVKDALCAVSDSLSGNESFETALEESGAFPPYLVHMAAIGSESGELEKVMTALAVYYKREHTLQDTLKSAVLYPAVLIAMMAAVLLLISIKVLPVFQTVLQGLGTELSPVAAAIMKAGSFFSRFSAVFVVLAVILVAFVVFFAVTERGKSLFSGWFSGTKTAESMALASLSSSLATLLSSGADPDRAIELSLPVLKNKKIVEQTKLCRRMMNDEHMTFMEAVEKAGMFPGITNSILSTGNRSGSLDTAMRYVADLYEESFEHTVMKKLSLIEPMSVAVLSALIGIILISVMFPLLSVMSAIGA